MVPKMFVKTCLDLALLQGLYQQHSPRKSVSTKYKKYQKYVTPRKLIKLAQSPPKKKILCVLLWITNVPVQYIS